MTSTRKTHEIDAEGKILGRLATEIANLLRGKHKVGFTYHQDQGDTVIVKNADKVAVSGKKEQKKMYYQHSFYPGGLKSMNLETMRREHPERIIYYAVRSMLPDNRLRDQWMKRLHIEVSKAKEAK